MTYAPKPAVEQWRSLVSELAGPLPVSFLLGLMDRLSSGDDAYEGSLGGRGLYQIHPNTATALGEDPAVLWDPESNTEIAVSLIMQRSQEIQAKDPTIAGQRPGDLGLLTTASYLWGPGTILPKVTPGITAAEIFSQLDAKVGQFAVDVFARAQAYTTPAEPDTAIVPSSTEPESKASALKPLLWLAGIAGVAVGAFFLFNPKPKRRK